MHQLTLQYLRGQPLDTRQDSCGVRDLNEICSKDLDCLAHSCLCRLLTLTLGLELMMQEHLPQDTSKLLLSK